MIYDGEDLNIFPFSFLQKLGYRETDSSSTRNTLRGYDSLKEISIGTIVLPLPATLRPKMVITNFYIIHRKTNYNMIIGKPWIHRMKEIISTLL